MARRGGVVCAAGVVGLLLAGCASLEDFNLTAAALLQPGGSDRVVAGSLDGVSSSTADALRQLGFFVSTSREGEAVRLRATTGSGRHFSLVLTRQKGEQGELTHVRFEWEGGRDEETELKVLAQVETPRKN